MNRLLVFIVPPLVGAIIGYVTNAIAIKMLFRPLRPWYIGRWRVPFTPGILPRQREKLADNIGRMVERELITPHLIQQRLAHPEIQTAVAATIKTFSLPLMTRPLHVHVASLSKFVQSLGKKTDAPTSQEPAVADGVVLFVQKILFSPPVQTLIQRGIEAVEQSLEERTVPELLHWTAEECSERVRTFFWNLLEQHQETLIRQVEELLERLYDPLTGAAIGLLKTEQVRKKLEHHGRAFLKRVILRLNVFQRLFLSAAQYDKTLDEKMPEIIQDLIEELERMLSDQKNKKVIIEYVRREFSKFIGSTSNRIQIATFLYTLVVPLLSLPVGKLVEKVGLGNLQSVGTALQEKLKDFLAQLNYEKLTAFIQGGEKPLLDNSLQELLGLKEDDIDRLSTVLTSALLSFVEGQVEGILGALNVKEVVRQRINSLEMEEVERIVLDVMASQFQWINIFGAILGALIGIGQVGLSFFMK